MPARNILVINCGSSSIKFALVNEAQEHFPSVAWPNAWAAPKPSCTGSRVMSATAW